MALLQRTTSPDFAVGGNTVISSSQVKAELNNIINGLNGAADIQIIHCTTTGNFQVDGNSIIGSASADTLTVNATSTFNDNVTIGTGKTLTVNAVEILKALVPIGSIIPFYDFNAALTFDTTYWKYCDGSTVTIGGSSRTTPDLSNRYLVGFGTEAGGDIDTASWATTVVGAASHQIDLSHTHTATTNSDGAHTHEVGQYFTANVIRFYKNGDFGNASVYVDTRMLAHEPSGVGGAGVASVATNGSWGNPESFYSNSSGAHTHTLTSSSSLGATQSIQPRSIRVRFIMRAA